ncbi:hypothetical protein [Pseudomonas chlororaphis]
MDHEISAGEVLAVDILEKITLQLARKEAKDQSVELLDVKVKTQYLTITEGEAFLKKYGPSAFIITGKILE